MAKYVELEIIAKHISGAAALCDVGFQAEEWVPLKVFETMPTPDDIDELKEHDIAEWFAMERGYI